MFKRFCLFIRCRAGYRHQRCSQCKDASMVGKQLGWHEWWHQAPWSRTCGRFLQFAIGWRGECEQTALCLDTDHCPGPFISSILCGGHCHAEPGIRFATLQATWLQKIAEICINSWGISWSNKRLSLHQKKNTFFRISQHSAPPLNGLRAEMKEESDQVKNDPDEDAGLSVVRDVACLENQVLGCLGS